MPTLERLVSCTDLSAQPAPPLPPPPHKLPPVCCCIWLLVFRLRLPNEWDSLLHWQDLMVWRNHIYDAVITIFQARQQDVGQMIHQMGYKDKAWAVNQLGHVATR